jgi:cyanophycinase-like exopeptidase
MLPVLVAIAWGLSILLSPAPARAEVWHHLDGNPQNVAPTLLGPAYDLGGGGSDVVGAMQWMIDQVRGCEDCSQTLDLVVLRFLTDKDQEALDRYGDQPNIAADYLGYHDLWPGDDPSHPSLQGLDSIETFVFANPARQEADDAAIAEAINKAEVVFWAGGDQCKYARNFKRTAVESAIESVQARGGGIGGTSAGAMIQGQWIFNACSDAVNGDDALTDPYEDILFTDNLFNWPELEGTLVETHFYQDDRMGRALTFVARLLRDGVTDQALAIGIDEQTSLLVDAQGHSQVMANDEEGSVYFLLGDRQPDWCEPGESLSFSNYQAWRVRNGEAFDLNNIPSWGTYQIRVNDGQISPSHPYRG